jgi:hypothetical protein
LDQEKVRKDIVSWLDQKVKELKSSWRFYG